uniref:Uncharacterized protein n=1 Tax=Manihot esculenta TaxID=3983 RepID=A0A2C9VWV9_MANES
MSFFGMVDTKQSSGVVSGALTKLRRRKGSCARLRLRLRQRRQSTGAYRRPADHQHSISHWSDSRFLIGVTIKNSVEGYSDK